MIATISQKLTSRRRTARAINSAMAAAAIAHPATAAPQVLKIYQHRPPAPVQAATPPSNDQHHRRRRHQHDGADADHVLCRVPEVDGPKEVVRVGGLGRQVADQPPARHRHRHDQHHPGHRRPAGGALTSLKGVKTLIPRSTGVAAL
jgi:hypothetical protein